jgi:hypothetical protein
MPTLEDCLINAGVTKENRELVMKYKDDPVTLNKRMTAISETKMILKNQARLQRAAQKNIELALKQFKDPKDRAKAIMDLMSGYGVRGVGDEPIVPLERKIQEVLSPVHTELADMMEAYRPKKLGFSYSKDAQRAMIRSLYGEVIDDADAVNFAKSWTKATTKLLERFGRAAGRSMKKLADWNLPQNHNAVKINRATAEEWYEFIRPRIRGERILPGDAIHKKSGEVLTTAEREQIIKKVLMSVNENLRTDGVSPIDTSPLKPFVKAKVGNRHQEHRLLHFKKADDWLDYADNFGDKNYFNSMMNYTEGMAREIGAMEMFGPNPDALVTKLIASTPGEKSWLAKNTYDLLMGRNYGFNNKLGWTMQGLRDFQAATKLGFAPVAALSDSFFVGLTAAFNGLPVLKTLVKSIGGLATHGSDRVTLNKIGLLGEYALERANAIYRLSETTGFGKVARLADMSVRASGLNYWTAALKEGFQLEFAANIAELAAKSFDELNPRMRKTLRSYGISQLEWTMIRDSKKFVKNNVSFVDMGNISNNTLKAKIIGMIKEETSFAVPEPNAKTRAILQGGTKKGTLTGELIRSMSQFKAFPASILMTHFHRALNLKGISRLGYFGTLITGTTALGMMVVQAKDMLKGKDPRQIDAKLVLDGLIQGGSLGLIGDFMLNDPNNFGGIPANLAGPIAGDAQTMAKLAWGSYDDVEDVLGTIGPTLARKYTPGQFWYTKLAMERYMMDSLEKNVNKNWYQKQRKLTRRMQKEKAQGWWWKPGTTAPTRAPRQPKIDF